MSVETMQPSNTADVALPHLGLVESIHRPWWSTFLEEVGAAFRPQEPLPPLPQYRPALPGELDLGPLNLDSLRTPWFQNLQENFRLSAAEKRMPAFQPTSQPVQVKPIWGEYGNKAKALPISAVAHVLAVILIATVFRAAPVAAKSGSVTLIIPVDINPYLAQLQIKPKAKAGDSGGGGGGGTNSPLPPSKGRLPRFKMEQITPPQAVIPNENPRLAVEPSVIVPPDVQMPTVDIAAFGDPLGKIGPPSNGPGSGGGIGTGRGGGVGSGSGAGVGPGSGGGIGGGAFRVGGGVSAPALLRKVEPEYSEEARKAKYQGTVQLAVEVWPDGRAHNIRVIRSLGLGLDEKAIEAVQQWQFAPGKKDGAPVKVMATIEVNFRLL